MAVRQFLLRNPRIQVRFLPAYAPELNPVEPLWAYLKRNSMANFAPPDVAKLASYAKHQVRKLQHRRSLLPSFIRRCGLFL
jgi:transposase